MSYSELIKFVCFDSEKSFSLNGRDQNPVSHHVLIFQLGSLMDQTHRSGAPQCKVCRKQIVSPREDRGGDLSHVNSNFNGKLHS